MNYKFRDRYMSNIAAAFFAVQRNVLLPAPCAEQLEKHNLCKKQSQTRHCCRDHQKSKKLYRLLQSSQTFESRQIAQQLCARACKELICGHRVM